MALARYHSRIFAAWRQFKVQFDNAGFPAHARTGLPPVVSLVDSLPEREREVVAIVPVVDDDDIEWVQLGAASRSERFAIDVLIRTRVPGCEGVDVIDRLEELAVVVQDEFYDTTTGQFTPPDFPGAQALGGVGQVRPYVWADTEGWCGDCLIRVLLESRI